MRVYKICDKCNIRFSRIRSYDIHMIRHAVEDIKYNFCDKDYGRED